MFITKGHKHTNFTNSYLTYIYVHSSTIAVHDFQLIIVFFCGTK